MWCPRCDGLMVPDRFRDYWDDTGGIQFYGFRCVICGEVIDQEILANREALEPVRVRLNEIGPVDEKQQSVHPQLILVKGL